MVIQTIPDTATWNGVRYKGCHHVDDFEVIWKLRMGATSIGRRSCVKERMFRLSAFYVPVIELHTTALWRGFAATEGVQSDR